MNISVENLSKNYGPQKAVDDISFEVKTGEVLGFLGPNGAGKSTTMKIITCFIAPSSGNVKVGELSIHEDAAEIKKKIGYLPENNPLYLDMAVLDYLRFVAELQNVPKSIIDSRIREMVGYCGLSDEKHKKIGELSKGYRQRVGLAQAMIHDPEILILDEPTSGLDPNQIVEIRNLIKELGKEKTIILSTHILPEVEATCDRILIINKGKLVADGTPESLQQQAQGQEILTIEIEMPNANGVDATTALQELPSVNTVQKLTDGGNRLQIQSKPDMSSRKPVFQLCVDKGWFLTEMSVVQTKLEDIFRDLTD
ncbi:MAG: ATP-binding cassette domain-containing protein [Bacteroidia bacterium]|nr:ATP-binding cassette domain-containing protein [Bacteroidia bacterium]